MQSFNIVHREALPHGILVGVRLPSSDQPIPDSALSQLLPAEREIYETRGGSRKAQFLGGRIAAHAACKTLGMEPTPVLCDSWGAPVPTRGISISITHKDRVAFALVGRSHFGQLGVDFEPVEPSRMQVASKVLRPEELKVVESLPVENQWGSTLIRFTLKEAIYKALAPRLKRYIGFNEALVSPDTDGIAEVSLMLESEAPPCRISARYHWIEEGVLATIRVNWQRG
jgi:enterobactin synthetase component D